MSYTVIDKNIDEWAKRHSLHVYRKYQDDEVRSVDLVSGIGERFQIWIDRPNGTEVNVHAWDFKERKQDWNSYINELDTTLDEAVQTCKSWMVSQN